MGKLQIQVIVTTRTAEALIERLEGWSGRRA